VKFKKTQKNSSTSIIEDYLYLFILETPVRDNHIFYPVRDNHVFYKLSDSQNSISVSRFHLVSILMAINSF
jgi:hypothetical protein